MEHCDSSLVRVIGLSRRLNLPAAWLKAEAKAGRIPCLRAGRHLLFNPSAVTRTLASRAATETPQEPTAGAMHHDGRSASAQVLSLVHERLARGTVAPPGGGATQRPEQDIS